MNLRKLIDVLDTAMQLVGPDAEVRIEADEIEGINIYTGKNTVSIMPVEDDREILEKIRKK